MAPLSNPLEIFEDAAALTRQLADRIRELLDEGICCRGGVSLVVSGGSTPVTLFETLSGIALAWNNVTITLADERWIAPDSPDSNEHLVRTYLLKNQAAAAHFIGLKVPAPTAREGEDACNHRLQQIPRPFDLLILGMGSDGHTASLFPGAIALPRALDMATTDRLCMAISPKTAPHDRMTLTLPALLNTRRIFVHITGESKRAVYEKALSGNAIAEMPIRAILNQNKIPVTVWWAP